MPGSSNTRASAKGAGIFRNIEAGRVELVEGIEGGRGQAGDAEWG
jgi:hypothetical protein